MELYSLQKTFICAGALMAFLGVAGGAFGAHFLKSKLSLDALNIFEVGIRYQMYHAIALLIVAWVYGIQSNNLIIAAGCFFIAGIVIFSGSLYMLSLSAVKSWGAITPIGGLMFLIGWICLAIGVLCNKSS